MNELQRLAELSDEIRRYPTPIARCDEQLTGLLEQRAVIREIALNVPGRRYRRRGAGVRLSAQGEADSRAARRSIARCHCLTDAGRDKFFYRNPPGVRQAVPRGKLRR